jgi:eukaryotic-like serine/threonine-protein kinase
VNSFRTPGQAQATAVSALRAISDEAESQGLKYISIECSLYAAEGLLNAKKYPQAQEEIQRALSESERLGLRALIARSHHLLSRTLQLSGNPTEAGRHAAEARDALEDIRKEAGNDNILKRSDLSPIAALSR